MLKCYDCENAVKCKLIKLTEPACDRFQPKGVNYNGNHENKEDHNQDTGKETRD